MSCRTRIASISSIFTLILNVICYWGKKWKRGEEEHADSIHLLFINNGTAQNRYLLNSVSFFPLGISYILETFMINGCVNFPEIKDRNL